MYSALSSTTSDIYGFPLTGLSPSELHIRQECLGKARQHLTLWMKTIRTKDTYWFRKPAARRKLKSLIRRAGIPPELRAEVWTAISGAKVSKAQYPTNYYQNLLKQSQKDEKCKGRAHIDAKTAALFRNNVKFDCNQGFNIVANIFAVYRKHRPERLNTATVPGLASIIAFLLIVIGTEKEEDVFWLFDSLIENKILPHSQRQIGFNCQVQESVLEKLLNKKKPHFSVSVQKFASLDRICTPWFSSLFLLTLPSETAARVWDCIFCEGSKVLQRVSLALLNKNKRTVYNMSQSYNLPTVLTSMIRRTVDANALLYDAFNSVGSMSSRMLERLGQLTESEISGHTISIPRHQRIWKCYP